MTGKTMGPARPIYVPDGIGVGGGGVSLIQGPAEPVYMVDETGQIFNMSTMYAEVLKIDSAPTDGLLGVVDSLAYRVHELEKHIHNDELFFGAALVPSGEDHVADRIGTTTTAFQMNGGIDTWGPWLQIAGPDDWPAAWVYADIRHIEVVGIQRANTTHFMQITRAETPLADPVMGTFTEYVFRPTSTQGRAVPLTLLNRRAANGTKMWARVWAVGQVSGTVDFFTGAHGYPG